jgi:hypothetical protein
MFVIFEVRKWYCECPVTIHAAAAAAAESVTSKFYGSFGVNNIAACDSLLFVLV